MLRLQILKSSLELDSSNLSGDYTFPKVSADDYIFSCKTSKAWGGGTPLDALIVNRYYIGAIKKFGDALKKLAADVNKDGKINPTDALLINRRFIGAIKSFPAGDWLFQKTDTVLVNTNTQNNILALCVGDVLGGYKNIPTKLIPDINYITEGNLNPNPNPNPNPFIIDVPVSLTTDLDIAAIGLKFNVQNSMFKVVDIISDIDGLIYNIDDNNVAIAWSALYKSLNLKQGDVLFKLKLQLTSNFDILTTNNYQLSTNIISDPVSLIAGDNAQRIEGVKSVSLL